MTTAFLDTETGGRSPSTNALLDVGLHFPDSPLRDLSIVIYPGPTLTITDQAKQVNGWPKAYEGLEKHTESEAIDLMERRLQEVNPQVLICHNAPFDTAFAKFAAYRTGLHIHFPRTFCTMSIGHALNLLGGFSEDKDIPSLDFLLKELCPGYQRPHPHRAIDDAKATAAVYKAMVDRFHFAATLLANPSQNFDEPSNPGENPETTGIQSPTRKHPGLYRGWRR